MKHTNRLDTPGERLSLKLVSQLFIRMQSNYGNKFSSQFASSQVLEATKKEWAYALYPYNVDDISFAIREMQQHYKEWPPTIGQFIELCKKHYKVMPMLDPPKVERSDKASGNAAIAKIRKTLGMKSKS